MILWRSWRSGAALAVLAAALLLSGCGESAPTDPAVVPVTLYYPSGRIMAQGAYLPGSTTRTGEWREFFDRDGSPPQWRRVYVAGVWDPKASSDWQEWNPDGSIRMDGTDR
jgi:hypothetical protein